MDLVLNCRSKPHINTILAVVTIQQIVLRAVWADCNAPPASGSYSNATSDRFAAGTTIAFFCGTGFNIVGRPVHRTCLGGDKWTDGPDRYNCEIKVTSIAIACVVCVVILVLFALLIVFAMKRLRKPRKQKDVESISNENNADPADLGQENPYFIENGSAAEDDLNLDLFDMDGGGDGEGTSGAETWASTLPRMGDPLPEIPSTNGRFSTFPKAAAAAGNSSDKEKDHIYDSIKHFPPALGESKEINNEPFTRV